MNEQAIVKQMREEVGLALPTTVSVRTSGGDGSAAPPLSILSWNTTRLQNHNGANPNAGKTTDENGDVIGRELHRYHRMTVDVVVRAYDEGDRDNWLSDVQDRFLPYEYNSDGFDPDTFEWDVGDAEPRSNSVIEPDWYESGITISFGYVRRVTDNDDTLDSVQEGDVQISETL